MRRTRGALCTAILLTAAVFGCRKNHVESKIIHGLPVVTSQENMPVRAAQELHLLTHDITRTTVLVVSRVGIIPPITPPELTPLNDGSFRYSFQVSDPHYGTFTGTMQFYDANGPYDPIPPTASTSPLTAVTIQYVSGRSSLFGYTGTWTYTLATAGLTRGAKTMTGTAHFTGQGYSIDFSYPAPGSSADVGGLNSGALNGTGTGPSTPVSISLAYQTDTGADGTLHWEGNDASLHINPNGTAFIVTNGERVLFE